MFISHFTIFELIVLIVFAMSFFVQIFYYLYFYLRVAIHKVSNPKPSEKQPPVSVVICARNEEENLKRFLPEILEQDYPNFEVVVVNDRSEDDTDIVLKGLQHKYPHLYVTQIPQSNNSTFNKKLALSIGLKAAKNEYVLLTDADCKPISNQWIKSIQSKFADKTDFVIGYGAYSQDKGLLNKIIRYDTFTIAIQYMGFALRGVPYMGVGRNLAYRKSFFFKSKGFSSHLRIASGDDDLFVNENANKENLRVALNPDSFTVSLAKKSFEQWFKQKKRHLCTGKYYKKKHKYLLGLELTSRFLFYSLFILSFFYNNLLPVTLAAFLIRYILHSSILYFSSKKFQEKGVFYLNILFDILVPVINLTVFVSNIKFCKKSYQN